MRRHDIVIECNGNLQVSGKQDTYCLEIKEDFGKYYCFLPGKKHEVYEINHIECFKTSEILK